MKFVLCGFGNPDNRGCEAIIRTISFMIKEEFPDSSIIALCNDYGRVPMIPLETIDKYSGSFYPHDGEIVTKMASALFKVTHNYEALCYIENIRYYNEAGTPDVCVSVGGDNFCYSDKIDHFIVHHNHFKRKGSKLVHWGTSFEKSLMSKRLINDLNKFDLIMVRESISYDAVAECCKNENVYIVPDPAFIMKAEAPSKAIELEADCVGINISPMIISKEAQNGIVNRNTIRLINKITSEGRQVILIPHVASRKDGSGDYSAMKDILKYVDNPERCKLIDYTYSAPEYKWIISKCSMFIGARTHSTIAAYSTCVPTVVLGYSVKARGIAYDLFGTEKDYVVPVQKLKTDDDFSNAYEWLRDNSSMIKRTIEKKMPLYIQNAFEASKLIDKCVKG